MLWLLYAGALVAGMWLGYDADHYENMEQEAFCEGYGYAAGHPDCSI